MIWVFRVISSLGPTERRDWITFKFDWIGPLLTRCGGSFFQRLRFLIFFASNLTMLLSWWIVKL
ncbi:hypothetical protein ACS0TY_026114 [Phlomoides rotata]